MSKPTLADLQNYLIQYLNVANTNHQMEATLTNMSNHDQDRFQDTDTGSISFYYTVHSNLTIIALLGH